uniref:hypothetical protein n=1 Tax=uncultured Vibrio sp. TaxID=114054 RepID=UPI002620BA8A
FTFGEANYNSLPCCLKNTHERSTRPRQLLKIAKREGGYTNKDIEKKAGLKGSSSSLASRWLNGHALATERQMRYFINNYGHFLKRQLEHLYYQYLPDGENLVVNYVKLSGDIIFKHQIRVDPSREYKKGLSVLRLVVIENDGCYKLLHQYRAGLIQWDKHADVKQAYFEPSIYDLQGIVHSDNEEAHWYLWKVIECSDTSELIDNFENECKIILSSNNIVDWAKRNGQNVDHMDSRMFAPKHVIPMKFAFYQKIMKLGLQSDLLPF